MRGDPGTGETPSALQATVLSKPGSGLEPLGPSLPSMAWGVSLLAECRSCWSCRAGGDSV